MGSQFKFSPFFTNDNVLNVIMEIKPPYITDRMKEKQTDGQANTKI